MNKKNKTVLILFWNLGIGGVQTKMVDIANHITGDLYGVAHCHLVLREKPPFQIGERIRSTRSSIHYRPAFFGNLLHIPFSLYSFWQIATIRPDVVLTFLDHASFIAIICTKLIFWRKSRIILNEDTLTTGHTTSPIKRWLVEMLYPFADGIISPTIASKNNLTRHFHISPKKITVIPNWTIQSSSMGSKKIIYDLIYIGRFDKQKNLLRLLDAIKMLTSRAPHITLCMAGEGLEKSNLLLHIQKLNLMGNVTMLPSSHQVKDYLQRARVLVLTSHYEGMPVTLLEAMALGVPTVAIAYPGLSEYLTHNKTGLAATSITNFAQYIEMLLHNDQKRKRLGTAAAIEAKKRFGKTTMQKYIRFVAR